MLTQTKIKQLALSYLSQGDDEDHSLFQHIELLQKVLGDAQNRGREINKDFKSALRSVKHLEGKTTLTEDEHFEYEGTVGWVEDAAAEYQSHREVVAESILIALSRMIETRANALADILNRYTPSNFDKWSFFKHGPRVRNVYWAEGVIVGGNYVRHREEWKVDPYDKVTLPDGSRGRVRRAGNLVAMLPDKRSRSNAQVLVDLGFPAEDFLVNRQDHAFKLTKRLGLIHIDRLNSKFHSWRHDLVSLAKAKLSI